MTSVFMYSLGSIKMKVVIFNLHNEQTFSEDHAKNIPIKFAVKWFRSLGVDPF